MSELPTIVLVPGAWHRPACYNKIIKILQERHKLKCIGVTLPSTTGDPAATFKDDLDAARDAIAGETSCGRDVVVVAHSYGGMVGNSAVKGFTRPKSTSAQHTDASQTSAVGHVIGIILIASGFTLTGVAFMDPFMGRPPPTWRVNSKTGFADIIVDPGEFFYHDVPKDETEYWVSLLTPQSLKALFEGGEYSYAGWMDVPSWYIGTIEDRGLPVAMQRMTVGMARGMGASVQHRELPTSHSPFLSQPEETVQIMVKAVEVFSRKPVENAGSSKRRRNEMAIPEPRLLRPLTWFKFGLPLFFGNLMGKCILMYDWVRRLWRSE